MPRYPEKSSNSTTIIAKTEEEKNVLATFKDICSRDGYELRAEIFEKLKQWNKEHNADKGGNPQLQLTKFDGKQKHPKLCEHPGCQLEAEFHCYSAYPYGKDKKLCNMHRIDEERKRNIRASRKLHRK